MQHPLPTTGREAPPPREFHYRLPGRVGGWRPGAHRGLSLGAGLEFISHASLYDRPDPRRLDVRASLRHLGEEWLVRVQRQRVGITLHAVVDVSASMRFGTPITKLEVATDFVQAMALSAFRMGDAAGLVAFDATTRDDLFVPPRHGRGLGDTMAGLLARHPGGRGGIDGLEDAARQLGGRFGLVFIVSDFHWPLQRLGDVLDLFAPARVVPLVVWDPAEIDPPARNAIALLQDMESGRQRTVWLRPRLREAWRHAAGQRREALTQACASRGLRPFFISGMFDGDALSAYFLDLAA
jgi:hypothetical protein